MRKIKQFGERIANWELLSNNIRPYLEGMPPLQAIHGELEAHVADARQIDFEQETAKGLTRELTRRRQEAQVRGESLRARLSSHLRCMFGFTSEQLIQFGLSPLKRGTRRRRAAEQPEGGTQPPAAPAPAPATPAPAPTPQTPA